MAKDERLEKRLRGLIAKIAAGDCPRASYAEFHILCDYPGFGKMIQLESALGADRSGGNIITPLQTKIGSGSLLADAAKKWLGENPPSTKKMR